MSEEPKGIPFFSIKTGETFFAKLEPAISAMINSSDMGINASRGQDFGWRLGKEWVQRVKNFRRDQTQMSILTAKNEGQQPTTVQILYYMYGQELQDFEAEQQENENPFEEQYQREISSGSSKLDDTEARILDEFNADEDEDVADMIDDVITEDEEGAAGDPSTETAPATRSQKKQ